MARILGAVTLLLAAGFAAADDKKPDPSKGEEVTGKITLNGAPLAGAKVTFTSNDGKTAVAAEVKDDGAFKAVVPAGEHAVTVASLPPPKPKDPNDPPAKAPPIPAKYGDPKTSGITVTVAAGKNEIHLDLRSK